MKLAVFILALAGALNCFGNGAYSFGDEAWLGARANSTASVAPFSLTNPAAGAVADFDATIITSAPYGQTTFTDLISGVVAQAVGGGTPTNYGVGIYFDGDSLSYTNSPFMLGSNFTLEIIYRPVSTNQPSNDQPGTGNGYPSSIMDNDCRLVFGTVNGYGLCVSNGTIVGNWSANNYHVSSATFPTTNWIRPTWDIVDVAGELYTNGVVCGAGVGQPTNNFLFGAMGSTQSKLNAIGYVQAIRLWTNQLTSTQIYQLYKWNITNNSDYITGLIARWKMNDGSGTTVADSIGSHPFTMVPQPAGYPTWTNGLPTFNNGSNNGALAFQSNYLVSASTANFMDNFTNRTICYWYKGVPGAGLAVNPSVTDSGQVVVDLIMGKVVPASSGWVAGWYIFNEEFYDVVDQSFVLRDDSGDQYETDFCFPDDGTWHFVVDEVTTNQNLVFVDGEQVNANNDSGNIVIYGAITNYSNTNFINMGYDTMGESYMTSNSLDDVQFYDHLLNQSQIAQKLRYGPQ